MGILVVWERLVNVVAGVQLEGLWTEAMAVGMSRRLICDSRILVGTVISVTTVGGAPVGEA